jgi:hypothetical protein
MKRRRAPLEARLPCGGGERSSLRGEAVTAIARREATRGLP